MPINPVTFPTEEKAEFFLAGPAGKLEVRSTWPSKAPKGVAIICHPHPLYGGTMDNKVVTTLVKAMEELGLATVRFNFRGIGHSEGRYGNIIGEIEDLKAVKVWVNSVLVGTPIWLAGFSFGSYIAAAMADVSSDVSWLITVAPAVNHGDFTHLTHIQCPWLILQGDADEVVPYADVAAFATDPPVPVTFITIADASHFFHGKLLQLRELIVRAVNERKF